MVDRPFEDALSARTLLSTIRQHPVVVTLPFTRSLCAAVALVGVGLPARFQAKGVVVLLRGAATMADLQEFPDPSSTDQLSFLLCS